MISAMLLLTATGSGTRSSVSSLPCCSAITCSSNLLLGHLLLQECVDRKSGVSLALATPVAAPSGRSLWPLPLAHLGHMIRAPGLYNDTIGSGGSRPF